MSTKQILPKDPPKEQHQSLQFDLFTQFVTNNRDCVSNTVKFWENIPKYFFTPKLVEKLRTADGLANPYIWHYQYDEMDCSVKIQPALIEQKEGNYKAFFPGVTEELVEEALKKIFTDQQYGVHIPKNNESWVRFSLSMIKKELEERKRTRSLDEIKHAIDVMSGCIISLHKEGKEIWKGSILQDLVTVGRDEYLADTKAQHIARLPLFISLAINALDYRQFNYYLLLKCSGQLTRWIYKQLVNQFTQASAVNYYHFMYSSLARNSGLLQQNYPAQNRLKVLSALDELKDKGVLMSYNTDIRQEGRSIRDVKYTLLASSDFIKDQKAANMRSTQARSQAINAGLALDNSEKVIGIAHNRS